MADADLTVRLELPLLVAGQAQKEVTHNEALILVDAACAPLVESVGTNAPPLSPADGGQWIIGQAPTGAWLGAAGALATWTPAGWRFVQLPLGAVVTVRTGMIRWRRLPDGWSAPASVSGASGGATIDAECRTQLSALIAALAAQGLLAV